MMIKDIKNRYTSKSIRTIPFTSAVTKVLGSYNFSGGMSQSNLLEAYEEVPDIAFIIGYFANQISKTSFVMKDGNGEIIEKHPVIDLMKEPNSQESWYEFLKSFVTYYELFGNSYINAFVPAGFSQPSKMFILPSQDVTIEDNGSKDFRFLEAVKYILNLGYKISIPAETVLHKMNTNLCKQGQSSLYGRSNLASGKRPIASIKKAYEAKSNYYRTLGALGILTADAGGSNQFVTTQESDIKKVQAEYLKYGLSDEQYRIIATKAPLKYQSMAQKFSDLQILESIISDRRTIASMLNMPALLFTDESATFNNKKEVMREFWGAKAIPFLNDFYHDLTNFLKKWWPEDWYLEPTFENIPELREDEQDKHKRRIDDVSNGVRTRNEAREEIGREPSTDPIANILTPKTKINEKPENE